MGEREKGNVPQGERFFSRWSQRKLGQRRDVAAETTPVATPETKPRVQAGETVSAASEVAPLPHLDTLDETSDYSGFLSSEVTDELQRLALRKLFGSAQFNVRDGLDDYDEDYRSFEALGDTITADMRYRMERELGEAITAEGEPEIEATTTIAADETTQQATPLLDEEDESPKSSEPGTG
jgi:hypothetical protein